MWVAHLKKVLFKEGLCGYSSWGQVERCPRTPQLMNGHCFLVDFDAVLTSGHFIGELAQVHVC